MKLSSYALVLTCLFAPLASFAGELRDIEPVSVGSLEIWPITDADIEMQSSLLPQLDQYPQFRDVFANGPLPSVTRVYYLPMNDRKILFDTGWGKDGKVQGRLSDILAENNVSPGEITDIIMTHLDIDHIGGLLNGDEAAFPNANLWISRPEFEAWTNNSVPGRSGKVMELNKRIAGKYKDKIHLFDYGEEIMPGITSLDASGHTPGHTAYEISSGENSLIIGGDLIHIWPVQLPAPNLSTLYDGDQARAAESRIRILDRAAAGRSIFAGMHLPMISPVMKREDGGFNMREPR